MEKEGRFKLVGFFTILGTVAALLVVPEVRTFLGLQTVSSYESSNETTSSATAQPPSIKTVPSSFNVRVYNIDDIATVYINGTKVLRTSYGESSQMELTNQLRPGKNDIRFVLENLQSGYTYGFEIYKNNQSIFKQECGEAGVWGCGNQDFRAGILYDRTVSVTVGSN